MSFRESDYGFDAGRINGAWQLRGNCRDVEPETMWPHPLATSDNQVLQARLVCVGCTQRIPCLIDGAEAADWDSVRGSLTGEERKRLHRAGKHHNDHDYPEWAPARRTRNCHRCGIQFIPTELTSRRGPARCPGCTYAPCAGCGTTEPATRRKGMCDRCYAIAWRRKAAVAC